jgi:hypothetical protein
VAAGAWPPVAPAAAGFLNLDILLAHNGDQVLDVIWAEVTRWAAEPRRLHRGYTVAYLTSLLSQAPTAGQLRTA